LLTPFERQIAEAFDADAAGWRPSVGAFSMVASAMGSRGGVGWDHLIAGIVEQ
jgi:hypothetical protein